MSVFIQLSKQQKKELARHERVCRNERRHAEAHKPKGEVFNEAREHVITEHGGTLIKLAEG